MSASSGNTPSGKSASWSLLAKATGFSLIALMLLAVFFLYGQRLVQQPDFGEAEGAQGFENRLEAAAEEAAEARANAPDTRAPAIQQLEQDLGRIQATLGSHLGLAIVDLESGEAAHFNGEVPMPQQSVSKLWVALAALDMSDRGLLDLSERATVRLGDLTLFHQPIRKQVLANGSFTTTYSDYMRRALVSSDNTANDMVLKRVGGPEAVRQVLADKGLSEIRFGPGERIMQSELAGLKWDQSFALGKTFFEARKRVDHGRRREIFDDYVSDPVDGASALSIARALAKLAQGQLLSPASSAQLIGMMRDAKSGPNRLKGGLPQGWSIAHKTGTGQVLDIVPPGVMGEQTGYNDVGLVTAPDGARYAVSVMIGHTRRPVPERMDMMHAVMGALGAYHIAKTAARDDGAPPADEGAETPNASQELAEEPS